MTREQRYEQLLKMFRDRHRRNEVVSLFHRILPEGETPRAGMSMCEVILEHEFGPATTSTAAEERP
jgi:hypothetical protein